MNRELANAYYLFSFTHIASQTKVNFIPKLVNNNCRFDRFRFIEQANTNLSLNPPAVNFFYQGQYYYSIYEQIQSGNTNPELAYNKVETGRAVVISEFDNTENCLFEPYISPDEDFAQTIWVSEEEQVCESYSGQSFVVGTGATANDACANLCSGNTIVVWVYDNGTIPQYWGVDVNDPEYNLFAQVPNSAQYTWWLDAELTIPLPDMWIANDIGLQDYKRQEISSQLIVGGTFADCSNCP